MDPKLKTRKNELFKQVFKKYQEGIFLINNQIKSSNSVV